MSLPVQELVTDAELEALVANEPEDTKIMARMMIRHQRAMNAITAKSRQWAATIGKIQLEEILGQEIDA